MEAMWCGRAAMVTDVAGNAEWIEEGITGFVASAPTVGLIAEAMDRAWAARATWEPMGQACHQHMEQYHDPRPEKQMLEQMMEQPECYAA